MSKSLVWSTADRPRNNEFFQSYFSTCPARHFYPCDPVIKMSLSLYNLKYDLNSELIDENTILYDRNDLNKIKIASGEKLNNFITKSTLFYILSELNHDIIVDFEIIGVGKADLYDLTTRTVYMFDLINLKEYQQRINELYEDSEVDVISINIEELPDDIFQRYLKLREYVIYE